MNKSIIYALASSALVLATGCTDLDVDVKSKYTEYPTESEIALEAKMSRSSILSFVSCAFGIIFKKQLPNPMS